jgi:hypothetical protein
MGRDAALYGSWWVHYITTILLIAALITWVG